MSPTYRIRDELIGADLVPVDETIGSIGFRVDFSDLILHLPRLALTDQPWPRVAADRLGLAQLENDQLSKENRHLRDQMRGYQSRIVKLSQDQEADGRRSVFLAAQIKNLEANLAAERDKRAACTCNHGPDFEGTAADCPEHGALVALRSAQATVRELRAILGNLVRLKDGPRDGWYLSERAAAWQDARDALLRAAGSALEPERAAPGASDATAVQAPSEPVGAPDDRMWRPFAAGYLACPYCGRNIPLMIEAAINYDSVPPIDLRPDLSGWDAHCVQHQAD